MLSEFLLSIGKVTHGKCLYTYLYNNTYNASLTYAFNMITHHVTHPTHGPQGVYGYYVVRVLHRLGVIKVPTGYRESEA